VDYFCGLGIERAGRFVCKEERGIFCKLPGKDHPLFLAAREVAGNMHHPVREPDLVDEVCSAVDRLIGRVIDIVERMEDVFDNAVVSIERKRPLEHDRGPAHHPGLQDLFFRVP